MHLHLPALHRRIPCGLIAASLVFVGAACGGSDAGTADDESTAVVSVADTASSEEPSDQPADQPSTPGIDIPEGMLTAEGLIPELAGLPVPEGAVFGAGSANDAEADPRQTAVQPIFFALPVETVVAFYLDELPAAGYEIESGMGGLTDKSEIVPGEEALIRFNDPNGLPGQVIIRPGSFAESQLNVNVFRSGVR